VNPRGGSTSVFGAEYPLGAPAQYQTRVRNAQEAHEASRPTDFALTPQELERRGILDWDERPASTEFESGSAPVASR